jgi:hypothetical protein
MAITHSPYSRARERRMKLLKFKKAIKCSRERVNKLHRLWSIKNEREARGADLSSVHAKMSKRSGIIRFTWAQIRWIIKPVVRHGSSDTEQKIKMHVTHHRLHLSRHSGAIHFSAAQGNVERALAINFTPELTSQGHARVQKQIKDTLPSLIYVLAREPGRYLFIFRLTFCQERERELRKIEHMCNAFESLSFALAHNCSLLASVCRKLNFKSTSSGH